MDSNTKHLFWLVAYALTGLILAILFNAEPQSQQYLADIITFLSGGLTGYVMHNEDI